MSEEALRILSADFVQLSVTTDMSKSGLSVVKKFQRDLTVCDLKQRLELITGRNANTMTVTALTAEGVLVCRLDENYKLLGSYPLVDGIQLLVEDPMFVQVAEEDDEDLDKRFQLSEEQYANRKGTLKEFLKRNNLGKYNPEIMSKKEEEEKKEAEERQRAAEKDQEMINSMQVGNRCEIVVPNQLPKRGVVMFKGGVQFADGLWVGVKYDEPFGKNDGSVDGVKYFEAPRNYGAFVKPAHVKVGDYPEITCGLEYDDEF